MSDLEARIAELEQENLENHERILSLEVALGVIANVLNPLAGEGYSVADVFDKGFSAMQSENPDDASLAYLETIKQK